MIFAPMTSPLPHSDPARTVVNADSKFLKAASWIRSLNKDQKAWLIGLVSIGVSLVLLVMSGVLHSAPSPAAQQQVGPTAAPAQHSQVSS